MQRERIDKTMSHKVMANVIYPVVRWMGAKHLVKDPFMKEYNHEDKNISYGLGYKHHGDKRHRTTVGFEAIYYADGKQKEGKTNTVEIDHRVGWSRQIDNRKVTNKVTVSEKIVSFEETFNKLATETSLDIVNSFSASAKGEIAGIGGSATSSTTTSLHTQINTEQMNHTKRERVIDDTTVLDYPGPVLYEADEFDENGKLLHQKGSVQYEGEIWLIERPVLKLQTTTPMKQWGVWDCGILYLNVYDWAGYGGVLPSGEHKNTFKLNGLKELLLLIKGDLVLQYPWSGKAKQTKEIKKAIAWLENEDNRRVGPVEWDKVRLNEDVASLEPSIVTP